MRPPHLRLFAPALASVLLSGCFGDAGLSLSVPVGAASGLPTVAADGADAPTCVPEPPPAPFLRRLSNAEYVSSLRDLVDAAPDVAKALPPDVHVGGFDNRADALSVSVVHLKAYAEAAEAVTNNLLASPSKRDALLGCDVVKSGDACLSAFIQKFGRRVYRRVVSPEELAGLLSLANEASGESDPFVKVRLVLQAMLQSPAFLYRFEEGVSDPAHPGVRRLTGDEVASRLSFLLLGTTPDDALLGAAASGALDSAEGVKAAATSLLTDARAHGALQRYGQQWLRLNDLDGVARSTSTYAGWTPDLPQAMREETSRLLEDHIWTDGKPFLDLLVAPYTYVNAPLAQLYGLGTTVAPTSGSHVVLRMHAGGGALTDEQGVVWAADQGFAGGATYSNPIAVAGTNTPSVYQSGRIHMTGYALPVPASGTYTVRLHFADLYLTAPGLRVMDITAEGQPFAQGLDLVAAAGPATAHVVSRQVTVTDGTLDLGFTATADITSLCAVEILQPDTSWVKVAFAASDHRVGVLTHASLLTMTAPSEVTAPILRGKLVREAFLCDKPPPPPSGIPGADDLKPGETVRERLDRHRADPACSGCHQMMDPIGFGLEQYDSVGRFRTSDAQGKPLTGQGEVVGQSPGTFTGSAELAQTLRDAPRTSECVVTHLHRYAYGRSETPADACGIRALNQQFQGSAQSFLKLLVHFVQSDAFLTVGETP